MTTSTARCLLAAAFLFPAWAGPGVAQPTFERTLCLHPVDQALAGSGLALAATDWDDDGASDLAYGAPFYDYEPSGDTSNGHFSIHRLDPFEPSGWEDWAGFFGEDGSQLGRAIAAGDFDGDGLDELARSSPSIGGGEVRVVEPGDGYCCDQVGILLLQGASGISGTAETGDGFGFALSAGDFDDDGYDDLAVGVPYESWSGSDGTEQGAVQVFYGTADGLDGGRDLLFGQDAFAGQTRENGDRFGRALAAGDLDGDGYADLVIGVPFENEGAISDSGIVHVVFGGASGLDFDRRQNWSQSSSGIASSPEAGDSFGWSLAVGNFDRTELGAAWGDVAISAACEADGTTPCAGAVHVLYGSSGGPSALGSQLLLRPGGSLANAAFGTSLLAADLDADQADDLVVGSPAAIYPPPPATDLSGEVHRYYGLRGGQLRDSGLGPWRPFSGLCSGTVAYEDFGEALAAGDFDADGHVDLAIGVPGWSDEPDAIHKGAAIVLFGSDAIFRDGFETGDTGRW